MSDIDNPFDIEYFPFCPACDGESEETQEQCHLCGGRGEITRDELIKWKKRRDFQFKITLEDEA